jgi:hypothetical protein
VRTAAAAGAAGGGRGVCSSVGTSVDEGTLEAAIASVTRALAATDDAELAAQLVAERRALRDELSATLDAKGGAIHMVDRHRRCR